MRIRVSEHTHLTGVAARAVCPPNGCRGGYMVDVHVYILCRVYVYIYTIYITLPLAARD